MPKKRAPAQATLLDLLNDTSSSMGITAVENRSDVFTVSEVSRLVQQAFEVDPVLGQKLTVRGELSNVKTSSRGHIYFTLKDEEAALNGVMWGSTAKKLTFTLEDGLDVFVTGKLDTYAPNGSYSIVAQKMEPVGIGALQLAYQQIKEKLAAEGLFDADHKQQLPSFPQRIAIITSPTGAVIHDMLRVLQRKNPMVSILLAPVTVQGEGAADDIAATLRYLNEHQETLNLDLIILARGGGSFEDLFCFSEEAVVWAVFESDIPIITGIGHEPDYALADAAADYSASTPTAAAEAAVPDYEDLLGEGQYRQETLAHEWERFIARHEQTLDRQAERFIAQVTRLLDTEAVVVAQRQERLINNLHQQILFSETQLTHFAAQLEGYSPLKILARGYNIALDTQGNVIHSIKQVNPGDTLSLRFADGQAHTQVLTLDNNPDT